MKHPSHDSTVSGPKATAHSPEGGWTDLDSLRRDLVQQRDTNLRLAADLENFKRRSRQETAMRAAAQKDAFIRELLPVLDNLERALASGKSRGGEQLHQGVEMTCLQLGRLLREHGIEAQESVGRPFDPGEHEAVAQRHDGAYPDQTVIEVLQRGYSQAGKVFRPAKVVVNAWGSQD